MLVEATVQSKTARRWPWALLLIAAVLLPLYAFWSWSGQCVDTAPGAGESYCTSGPSIGWPSAWLLAAIGAVAFIVSAVRLVRLSLQRSGKRRT